MQLNRAAVTQGLSWSFSQGIGQSWSHLKASLGLEDHPQMVPTMPNNLHNVGISSVAMIWQQALSPCRSVLKKSSSHSILA